jgi:hypothetical protein
MTPKPRLYEQSGTRFVIGTSDLAEALTLAGIAPWTHRWSGTGFGYYARRQGLWRNVSEDRLPKDAKPGIAFFGPIRPQSTGGWV